MIFQYVNYRDIRCIANPPGYSFPLRWSFGAKACVLLQLAQGGILGEESGVKIHT